MRTRYPAAENAHGVDRLSSLSVSNQTECLWGSSYAYDVDRLASVTVTAGGASRATAYAYDLQGQLTAATGYTPTNTLDAVERFAYDAVGHQKSAKPKAQPQGDRDFGAARRHGARSGIPRRSGNRYLTDRSLSAPPPPSGREGAAAIFPNADDEAAVYRRHYAATLTGIVDSNAVLSLPLTPGAAVERDARGNWIAPFVPLYPMSNGLVRVQLETV
jgi:YD repeat-containing protein